MNFTIEGLMGRTVVNGDEECLVVGGYLDKSPSGKYKVVLLLAFEDGHIGERDAVFCSFAKPKIEEVPF